MPATLRLDQLLTRCGYCSRRAAPSWVAAGRITTVPPPPAPLRADSKVDPHTVLIDRQPVDHPDGLYLLFHKPLGVVCSHDEAEGPRLYDLLPPRWLQRHPPPLTAGRLDKDTSGLIIVTDDGPLIHRLTSPRHEIEKTYHVTVTADLSPDIIAVCASGQLLLHGESKPCRPAQCEVTGPRSAILRIHEGKYHQVRRMFASQGSPVATLHRTAIGALEIGTLAPGQWRDLTAAERATL